MSFLAELRRRSVYRVAALYLIVGWVVLQVVDVFTEFMPLPEWTGMLVFVLLAAGFPVSLVLAWALELTPAGLRREAPASTPPEAAGRGDKLLAAGLVLVLLLGGWRILEGFGIGSGRDAEVRSLVVLPLDNLMEDPGQAYFVEGMHEAIITELSRIEDLRVISRTSAMKYEDSDLSVPEIGAELGVDAVIEGSVLRSGGTVRVTAQMIEAATDQHIWADNFDRELTDILALYADVTREIAERIRLELNPAQSVALDDPGTVDSRAYDDYLRGSYLCEKWGPQEMAEGIDLMRRAVAEDPHYALAQAGLAICLQYAAFFDYVAPTAVVEEAMAAAERAIDLDPSLPDAWVSFAGVRYYLDFDFTASELALERALALNPSHVRALTHLSWQLGEDGRTAEAVALAREAMDLDPFTPSTGTTLAQALYLGGEFQTSVQAWRDLVELDPADPSLRHYLGWALAETGTPDEAIDAHRTAVELSGRASLQLSGLGHALAVAGEREQALALLGELDGQMDRGQAQPIHLAVVHLGLGNLDEAMDLLEDAFQSRNSQLLYLKQSPHFDPLRDWDRFQALLRRMGW